MRHAFKLLALAVIAAGCAESAPTIPQIRNVNGAALAAATSGGGIAAAHFAFLPPLVPSSAATGAFDAALSPVVEVCRLDAGTCAASVATFSMAGDASEAVRVDAAGSLYIVNWHTGRHPVVAGSSYRIGVLVAGNVVGSIDVQAISSAKDAKSVAPGRIALVAGSTLPIKFRLEEGLVAAVVVTPNPVVIKTGSTATLTASVADAHGNALTGATVTWASSDANVASVDQNGTVTGEGQGTATITATSGSVSGSSEVTVQIPIKGCTIPKGAIGYWPFDEGSGNLTADRSGNGHDGSLSGTPAWTSRNSGSSLSFADAQDLVNIGSFMSDGVSQLSVGAWVNPTSFSNTGDVPAGGGSGPRIISATDGDGWSIGHRPGLPGIQVQLRSVGIYLELDTPFPLNEWSHVAVVYDGASVQTYLNGLVVDSRSAPAGVIRQASSCTFIGNEPEGCARQTNGNFAWQGGIDDVAVFDRALMPDEVLMLAKSCTVPGPKK